MWKPPNKRFIDDCVEITLVAHKTFWALKMDRKSDGFRTVIAIWHLSIILIKRFMVAILDFTSLVLSKISQFWDENTLCIECGIGSKCPLSLHVSDVTLTVKFEKELIKAVLWLTWCRS